MTHDHGAGAHHLAALLDAFGLPASLFVIGLIGSATHCSAMCGPFVFAQVAARLAAAPASAGGEFARLAGAALLPYQLGRLTTYATLGAVAGGLGGQLAAVTGVRWLAASALVLAAALFLLQAAGGWARGGGASSALGAWLGRQVAPLLRDPRGSRGYALGLALGLLPCGLLYGALAAAAASGGAVAGAGSMAAFAVGTMPALVGAGWLGVFFERRWRPALRVIAPPLLVVNAATLLLLAWRSVA
jgi:hypothetical protein